MMSGHSFLGSSTAQISEMHLIASFKSRGYIGAGSLDRRVGGDEVGQQGIFYEGFALLLDEEPVLDALGALKYVNNEGKGLRRRWCSV